MRLARMHVRPGIMGVSPERDLGVIVPLTLPAIFGMLLLVVVLGTIGAVAEYQLWGHVVVALIAAVCVVQGLAIRQTGFVIVALLVGGGTVYLAADTFLTGEQKKRSRAVAEFVEREAERLQVQAKDEIGLRTLNRYVNSTSPRFAEYTDRVDAKIRAESWFGRAGAKERMKPLCRITIAHELALRDPSNAKHMLLIPPPYEGEAWIREDALALFLSQWKPPRHPKTVSHCAEMFGFKVPT